MMAEEIVRELTRSFEVSDLRAKILVGRHKHLVDRGVNAESIAAEIAESEALEEREEDFGILDSEDS